MPMHLRARLGIGYLPQEESIFRKLSVYENIMAVLETMNFGKSEMKDRCYALMKRFGISATARASIALYNNHEDIDALIESLGKVHQLFG